LTSVPTGRAAYTDTRVWLLEQHGPVCAYCESAIPLRSVTLDHVTPRRGQTAYDRRDNLVLCCKACNAAKKDQAILAFLLGNKRRVVALYKYGQHLSHQLVEMVKDLLPEHERPVLPTVPHAKRVRRKSAAEIFGHQGAHASPYLDESPPAVPRHAAPAVHAPRPAHVAEKAHTAHAPRPAHVAEKAHTAHAPRSAHPVHPAPAPSAAAPAAPAAAAPKKKRTRRGGRGRAKKPQG
jgi:hypothetical protein